MDESRLMEDIEDRQVVFRGRLLRLEHWRVRLSDGGTAVREVARHIGASAVVAIDDQDRLVLVRQMRVPVERITSEIPAGKLNDPGEDPLTCARRELSEETGLSADSWHKLTVLDTTPGFCDEHIHIYLARGLHAGTSHPDADEFIDTFRLPLSEAVSLVMSGVIRDGKTCAGILMAQQFLAAQKANA